MSTTREYATLARTIVTRSNGEHYPMRPFRGGAIEVVSVECVAYLFTSDAPITPTLLYRTPDEVVALRELARDGWAFVSRASDGAVLLTRTVEAP